MSSRVNAPRRFDCIHECGGKITWHKGRASTINSTSEHSGLTWARHGLAKQRFKGGQIASRMRRSAVGHNVRKNWGRLTTNLARARALTASRLMLGINIFGIAHRSERKEATERFFKKRKENRLEFLLRKILLFR
jgi:hypothetical protein